MAFWGVEVKPGKPYIHRFDTQLGRLRLSQATLGSGSSIKRSIVQCSVGSNPPINLCSLLPEKNETSQLNLEFEEEEEVTLSVVGPTSVHLSGFYYGENEDDSEEDDNGLDYFEEDSHDSLDGSDSIDVDSMDDFNDEDLAMFAAWRKANSGVKIEEIENDKPANEKDCTEQQNVIDPVSESEDEDGFPISKDTKKMDEEVANKKTKNGAEPSNKLKRKEALREDGEHARNVDTVDNDNDVGVGSETKSEEKNKNKKKKLRKEEVACGNNETLDCTNVASAAAGEISHKATNEKKDKKKKKNKKKKQDTASDLDKVEDITEKESKVIETEPMQVRTFPNGMVVEELAMGKPDGKKASNGKRISMRYIGKLKTNGKIFDSNIGKAPFKFRLGVGQVIKGWDVGVNGMRVGDKRRLTIPPTMGYGSKGAGGVIPPNSWLVFDVELMDVN